jgi:hypothetical protein
LVEKQNVFKTSPGFPDHVGKRSEERWIVSRALDFFKNIPSQKGG